MPEKKRNPVQAARIGVIADAGQDRRFARGGDALPVEEPPMMATTPASLTLRAITDGRSALLTVFAVVIGIVGFVRSSLRERWNDGQSEDGRGDKDGLAKNLASRRVCEL